MANYREIFNKPHTVFPVVHVDSEAQAIRNTRLALDEGADGVFLIQMNGDPFLLANVYHTARKEFEEAFIGLNVLGYRPSLLFKDLPKSISALWTDSAEVAPPGYKQDVADKINVVRKASSWDGIYFGGVAMKHQMQIFDDELAEIARIATRYVDVITTSGVATGFAPTPDKINVTKTAVGNFPLAVASGMSPQNVSQFLAADSFLVASSLLFPNTEEFDRSRVRDFLQIVHSND